MKAEEKREVMAAFRAGDIEVLVATVVVEVGVDVPNASAIIIEGAERFGLSQLHQLRGRVCRGLHPPKCFLLGDPKTDDSLKTLVADDPTLRKPEHRPLRREVRDLLGADVDWLFKE